MECDRIDGRHLDLLGHGMIVSAILPALAMVASAFAVDAGAVRRARCRRLGWRRNDAGQCAHCGADWAAGDDAPAAFLVEVQVVCASCAPGFRRRCVAAAGFYLGALGLASSMFVFGWGRFHGNLQSFGPWGRLEMLAPLVPLVLAPLLPLVRAAWPVLSLQAARRANLLALEGRIRALPTLPRDSQVR